MPWRALSLRALSLRALSLRALSLCTVFFVRFLPGNCKHLESPCLQPTTESGLTITEIDPNHSGSIRTRAVGMTKLNQLDEAQVLMEPIDAPNPAYDPALFFVLAEGYRMTSTPTTQANRFTNSMTSIFRSAHFRSRLRSTARSSQRLESCAISSRWIRTFSLQS